MSYVIAQLNDRLRVTQTRTEWRIQTFNARREKRRTRASYVFKHRLLVRLKNFRGARNEAAQVNLENLPDIMVAKEKTAPGQTTRDGFQNCAQ